VSDRALSWPSGQRLATGISGAVWVSLVFFPVYLGCAAVTATRAGHWHPYADWELQIPFVPVMILPYLSMFVLFLLPPFQLDVAQLRALTVRLIVGSLLGGIIFLALPAEMGFGSHSDAGRWQGIYSVIYRIDVQFNTVPSFHVIYTALILLAMAEAATPGLRRVYWAWLVVVCSSTVLTHRHHLLDVAAGLGLALAVPALLARLRWLGALPTRRLQE
jgi:hypothetical protein